MTARRKQRKKASEQKIVGALDMPKILSPSVPHIETEGNKEAVVDGCFEIRNMTMTGFRLMQAL